MQPISSIRNPRIAELVRLHSPKGRRGTGRTIIEGPHLIGEALAADMELVVLLGSEESPGFPIDCPYIQVTPAVLRRVSDTENPRGPVGVMTIPGSREPATDVLWIDVGDPGNAGTLIRSAAAFGLDVVVAADAVDPWSPKVLRSAAGGHFQTRISIGDPPVGWRLVATVPRGGISPRELLETLPGSQRCAILIGDEARGLDRGIVERADDLLTLPMPGSRAESLNAGVAGAIAAYELSLWRNSTGSGPFSH